MVLQCTNCGWVGCDLVPNPEDNTARCPKCGIAFCGIDADHAVHDAPKEEKEQAIKEARKFI